MANRYLKPLSQIKFQLQCIYFIEPIQFPEMFLNDRRKIWLLLAWSETETRPNWLPSRFSRLAEGRGRTMGRMPLPPFSVHSFVLITRPLTPLARAFEKRAAGPKVAILCDQYCCTFFMATFVLRTYFQ